MDKIGVQVVGLTQAVRSLERLGVEVEDLRDAWGRIADRVKPIYEANTPKRTGRLRGDYRTGRAKGKASLAVGGARVPYARVIRWGWAARNIRANDWVTRADATAEPVAATHLDEEISRLISRLDLS